MKHLYAKLCFGLLLPVVLIIAGCSDKKTIKKKFNSVFQAEFAIADSNNVAYDKAQLLDLNKGDFGKNKADLIDFTVDSIKYYVYELNNDWQLDDKIVSAALKVSDVNNTGDYTLGQITDLNLNSNYDEGNARKLMIDNSGLAKFVSIVTHDPYKGYLKFSGEVEQVPINFKMRVKVYVTFNAWIL